MANLKLKEKNVLVCYGIKNNGDFITTLSTDTKVSDMVKGDSILVDIWTDKDGDLFYRVLNTWLRAGDYIEHLYDMYKEATNFDKAYLVKDAGDFE